MCFLFLPFRILNFAKTRASHFHNPDISVHSNHAVGLGRDVTNISSVCFMMILLPKDSMFIHSVKR